MSDIPVPKYKIGQVVFGAYMHSTAEVASACPDCLGKKVWSVTTPAGETFPLACGTCDRGGWGGSSGVITRYEPRGYTKALTIGSVQIDTNDKEHPVEYMCEETGVGSGTIHHEGNLFLNAADAQVKADKLAADYAEMRNQQQVRAEADAKKKAKRKPDWRERRIKELEQQLAEARQVTA